MKILDGKIVDINNGITMSWLYDNNQWGPDEHFTVDPDILQDPLVLQQWCQDYKDNYNLGKDIEAGQLAPASVLILKNTPLKLK